MGVQIRLLGGFAVTVDGVQVPDAAWRHSRPRDLVQLLALAGGHRLTSEQVLGTLWPDLDPMPARANLHKAAHLARRAVGSADAVVLALGMVELFPDDVCTVDAEEFEAAATAALRSADARERQRVRDLYPGDDLLPAQPYTAWVENRRERLRGLQLRLLREGGDPAAVVEVDPLDETAHIALIRRSLDNGRPAEALRRYARLAQTFRRELDSVPSGEARALRDEAARLSAPRPELPALVGRDTELGRVRTLLLRAQSGTGSCLLVEGEPGIGKTRLLQELVAEATDAGWPAARATADPSLPAPYAPIVKAVVRLLQHRPDLAAPDPGTVWARLEELTARGQDPLPVSAVSRDGHIEDLVTLLGGLLVPPGPGSQALLVLDDAHAADVATLDLVWHLAQLTLDEPLVIALSYRSPAPDTPLHRLRTALLARGAVQVQLGPLSPAAADSLVRQAALRAPDSAAAERLVALGEGSPFLLQELAAQVAEDGSVTTPAGLDDVVISRLGKVSGEAAVALERVAVVHTSFSREEFAAAADVPLPVADRILEQCVGREILLRTPEGFAFVHALVQDAFAGLVPPERRRSLHRDTARRLAGRDDEPGRIAYHFERSDEPGEAAGWLLRAAEQAAATGALADALGFAERGLAIQPRHRSARLLEMRADSLQALGDPGAGEAYNQVRRQAAAEDAHRLLVKQANAYLGVGDLSAAESCLDAVSDDHPGTDQIMLALARGFVAWFHGDMESSQRWAAEARKAAVRDARSFEAAEALLLDTLVAHSSGEWGLGRMPQAMRELTVPEVASKAWDPHLCIGIYLVGAEESYDEVADFMRRTAQAAAESGVLRAEAFAFTVLGGAAAFAGDVEQAGTALDRALKLQRRSGSSSGQSIALERMASVAQLRGDRERALELLDDADRMARTSMLTPHLLVRTHATRIEGAASPDEALHLVALAEGELAGHRICRGCAPQFLLVAAGACLMAGDPQRATAFLDQVRGLGPAMRSGVWAAAISEIEAGLAMVRGAPDEASRLLGEAERRYVRCGHLVAAERCRESTAGKDRGRPAS